MLDVTLLIQSTDGVRQVPLTEGRLTLGRDQSAQLYLNDQGLSRLHASIHREGERIWILDERSTNGTLVNGRPVAASGAPLGDGDEVRLGHHTIIRVAFAVPPRAEMAAPGKPRFGLPLAAALTLVIIFLLSAGVLTSRWLKGRTNDRGEVSSRDGQQAEESGAVSAKTKGDQAEGAAAGSLDPIAVTPHPGDPSSNSTPLGSSTATPEVNFTSARAGPRKLYQQMGEAERIEFIDRQAQRIAVMMGNRPYAFTEEVLGYIKTYVDGYAARANSSSTRLWGEGLPSLYTRATRYAPFIIRAFNARGVPPVVGLYIAMIETEYHDCLESPVGAKGLFQFMPDTARGYGVDPADRCRVEKIAPAAARYMADRIAEFGTDSMSVALGIAGYNRSPDSVRRDLHDVLDPKNKERSFWTLIANKEELDHFFQKENIRYVPKFFAAAIVGETPWAFGLQLNPLSTYTELKARDEG